MQILVLELLFSGSSSKARGTCLKCPGGCPWAVIMVMAGPSRAGGTPAQKRRCLGGAPGELHLEVARLQQGTLGIRRIAKRNRPRTQPPIEARAEVKND